MTKKKKQPLWSGVDNTRNEYIRVENRGGARKGAGRKSNAEKGLETRTHAVAVKFTETEYAVLTAAADHAGYDDLATYVRDVALAAKD